MCVRLYGFFFASHSSDYCSSGAACARWRNIWLIKISPPLRGISLSTIFTELHIIARSIYYNRELIKGHQRHQARRSALLTISTRCLENRSFFSPRESTAPSSISTSGEEEMREKKKGSNGHVCLIERSLLREREREKSDEQSYNAQLTPPSLSLS